MQMFQNTKRHVSSLLYYNVTTHNILILYRNCRKGREAHCHQYNQKVATQRDIQRIFQVLQEPVY